MKPEQRMWASLNKSVGGLWDATRHEDLLNSGTPDVSFGCAGVQGWIELKYIPEWPKHLGTIVAVKHFTPQQKAWLMRRGNMGGRCWFLLKVGQTEWLLYDHYSLLDIGKGTQFTMRSRARFKWDHVPSASSFLAAVTGMDQYTFIPKELPR